MYNKNPEERLNAVRYYLNNGKSLRYSAEKFNVTYKTLFKWVQLYKKYGEERLLSTYKRPWNRSSPELEEKIALLKEKDPALTIRKAKEILERQGIKISVKGIWNIWKRAGFAGFKSSNAGYNFLKFTQWSKEAKVKLAFAKHLFNEERLKEIAKVLNSVPFIPYNDLIPRIPDKFLTTRRKIEKVSALFGKLDINKYLKIVRNLSRELKKQGWHYSFLRIKILEILALGWSGRPQEQLKTIKALKHLIRKKKKYYSYTLFIPRITLLLMEGITNALLLKLKNAKSIANICENLLRNKKYVSPYFNQGMGSLYTYLEDYKKAEFWFLKAVDKVDDVTGRSIRHMLSLIALSKGDHKRAIELSKDAEYGLWISDASKYLFLSRLSLLKGEPHRTISFCLDALSSIRKSEINTALFGAYFTIASAYEAMGNSQKAKLYLSNSLKFSRKRKLKKYTQVLKIIFSTSKQSGNISFKTENILPTTKLTLLLKYGDYKKAFYLAKRKYLLTSFYRITFFFPEIVLKRIQKGKPVYLPKSILKLPVFNKSAFVFDVRFLGRLKVYRSSGIGNRDSGFGKKNF